MDVVVRSLKLGEKSLIHKSNTKLKRPICFSTLNYSHCCFTYLLTRGLGYMVFAFAILLILSAGLRQGVWVGN